MTLSRILLWSLALGLVAWAAWAWPGLPDRIPLHFGLDGQPDRWGERSVWGWFLLPAIGVGLAAMMDGIGRWSIRNPEKQTVNLPQSDELYALPVERRIPILTHIAVSMNVIGILLLAAFILFQIGSYQSAHGGSAQAWTLAGLAICLFTPMTVLVSMLTTTSAAIARQREA